MAWGNETAITADNGVGNTWTDAFTTTLNPGELLQVWVIADNTSGSVTDSAEVRVLTSPDSTDYDDTPVFAMSYTPSAVTAEQFSFTIAGYYDVKVQWRSSGGTDTYNFSGSYRKDGVSL